MDKGGMFLRRQLAAVGILAWFLFMGAGCVDRSTQPQEYIREDFVMNTLIQVRVFAPEAELGQKAGQEVLDEFTRIDHLTDRFAEKNLSDPEISDVYRINQNAGIRPVPVSKDTLTMLERGSYFSTMCSGAFDVTVGPLMNLWGFGQAQYHVPSTEELKSGLELVGYQQVVVDKTRKTVFLPEKGMEIDLGGIAKGYATDKAVQKLRQMGIESALINAGGSVYALGSKPDGEPWLVGIQDPRDEKNLVACLRIKDTAVVTSGDYERYFTRDGVCYHHILDPATGQPARSIMSSTIVAPSAADADVLSTALFVLGSGPGMELVNKISATDAVLVDDLGNITFSEGLSNQIKFTGGGGYTLQNGEVGGDS